LISINNWRFKKLVEFAGPLGQVDPNGQAPGNVPTPFVAGTGNTRPGMAFGQKDNLPGMMQSLLKLIKNRPASEVINLQNRFNTEVQSILSNRSSTAARTGMMANFKQARSMRANFGKPV
jgi:hypothetical protein